MKRWPSNGSDVVEAVAGLVVESAASVKAVAVADVVAELPPVAVAGRIVVVVVVVAAVNYSSTPAGLAVVPCDL